MSRGDPKLFDVKIEELHEMSNAKLDRLLVLATADHKAKSMALKKTGEQAVASYELLTELEEEAGRRIDDDDEGDPVGIVALTEAEIDDVW